MGNQEVKTNNEYMDRFIEAGLSCHLGLSLALPQLEVLRKMLTYDYVLFRHGRGVGATFLLSILSIILHKVNPNINIAIAATTIRQAKCVNSELEQRFKRHNVPPLDVVSIKESISGNYDILLLDEITNLPEEYIDSLITHIENRSISKIVATCIGYRQYFKIAKLENVLYKGSLNPDNNRTVIVKGYEDMPSGFFDLGNIKQAKKMFDHPEEFDMEYKGSIV